MTGSARAKWSSLRMHALSRALDCHLKMQLPVTRTSTMLGLEFLKVFAETVESDADGFPNRPSAEGETAKNIVQSWKDITHDSGGPGKPAKAEYRKVEPDECLHLDLEILEHPLFDLSLATTQATPLVHEDGSSCEINIHNLLPVVSSRQRSLATMLTLGSERLQDIDVSDVRICFSTTEIEQLWFTAGPTVLKSGMNHIDVTCLVSHCIPQPATQLKETASP